VPWIATPTVASEQIRMSRAKPLCGAEGALDILICSEKRVAVAIDDIFPNAFISFPQNYIAIQALAAIVSPRIVQVSSGTATLAP
jgi:hypothetical protein